MIEMTRKIKIRNIKFQTRVFNLNTFNEFKIVEFINVNNDNEKLYEIKEKDLRGIEYNCYLTSNIFAELNTFEFIDLANIDKNYSLYNMLEEIQYFKESIDFTKAYYIDIDKNKIRKIRNVYFSQETRDKIYIKIKDKVLEVERKHFDKILLKLK